MTIEEQKAILSAQTGENVDSTLSAFLSLAGDVILNRAYPFRTDIHDVPRKYQRLQIDIAAYLLNKRGAEGETAHNENGVNRSYESAFVPDSLLRQITPFAGVPKGDSSDEAAEAQSC